MHDAATGDYLGGFCAMTSSYEMRTFSINVDRKNVPKGVYAVLTDRKTERTYKSNCVSPMDGKPCP